MSTMKKRIAMIVVIGIAALLIGFKYCSRRSPDADSLRHSSGGDVIGFADRFDTYAWLGIPFAQPPVGELRWRAPRPAAPWSGVRKALTFSSMCPQVAPLRWRDRSFVLGSEDCLYLNVWTPRIAQPQLAQAKLPVMVWIHGGANTLGTSSANRGYRLAGTQSVVVVTLQYRLGLFGWFSHPALRHTALTPADASSNFALLDMIAALQWVRNNAAAFGGDPDNVTIFGQSAGAFDIFALLAAPPAKGLFQRAIAESGALRTVPRAKAENFADDADPGEENSSCEFIDKLLMSDGRAHDRAQAKSLQQTMSDAQLLEYLRGESIDQLLRVVTRRSTGLGYSTPTNIRDGYVLPDKPLMQVFADPTQYNSVPFILGSNRDEYKFFLWTRPRFTDMRLGFLPKLKDREEYDRISGYFSDQWQAVGVNEPANVLQHSQPAKVFAYRFDWADQPSIGDIDMGELFGAAHGIETTFTFGSDAVDGLPWFARVKDERAKAALSAAMIGYWATFAKTGMPGNGGDSEQPVWQPWQESGAKKMVFDIPDRGGIRSTDEAVKIIDLKQRLRSDPKIQTPRERCELYAQLFLYGMSSDFWSDAEYSALGCAEYPPAGFSSLM